MAKRKEFHKVDLSTPQVEYTRNAEGGVIILSETVPPAVTVVNFPFNPVGVRSFDFGPYYEVGVDPITYACQRQIERFLDKQDGDFEVSTVVAYARTGLRGFLEYLVLRSSALQKPMELADINREVIDGYLVFLRDSGMATTGQRNVYKLTKPILKALCRRKLVHEVSAGDDRTFPENPFPGASGKVKGETSLPKAQRQAFSQAVKMAVMPIFREDVEVTGSLLVSAFLVIALHTGRNTTPLLEMTPNCLRPHPKEDTMFLVLFKRRGHNTSKVALQDMAAEDRVIEATPTLRMNVTRLVQRVIELSNRLRDEAPENLRDRVWLYRSFGGMKFGEITTLTERTLAYGIQQLVEDYKLVDSDGRPLRINISRLRKTFVNRIFEILNGDIVGTAAAAGNTSAVVQVSYLRPSEDAQKNWLFMGQMLVQELQTNTLGATERTPMGQCSDAKQGDYAPKRDGAVCMSFLNCLRCRNYVVTGDDLYKLFSFYWRVLRERARMDKRRWERQFAHVVRLIDRDVVEVGLAKKVFKRNQVDAARERARHVPHPIWRSDTIISELEEMT